MTHETMTYAVIALTLFDGFMLGLFVASYLHNRWAREEEV